MKMNQSNLLIVAVTLLSFGVAARAATINNDFSSDPNWTALGNTSNGNNYGYQSVAQNVGGDFNRTNAINYYLDEANFTSGTYSLNDSFGSSGTILTVDNSIDGTGGINGGVLLGYASTTLNANPGKNFVGIDFDGSSASIGLFRAFADITIDGTLTLVQLAGPNGGYFPQSTPSYSYSFSYDPSGNGGNGAISVTFGGVTNTLNLTSDQRAGGLTFDSFGFTENIANQTTDVGALFLDNVTYNVTNAPEPSVVALGIFGIMVLALRFRKKARV